MRINIILIIFLIFTTLSCSIGNYDKYFTEDRIRVNYTIQGNAYEQSISDADFISEKVWGGSKINLLDTFRYGKYMLEVYDYKSRVLIYSRGFSNLFAEWQETSDAKDTSMRYRDCILFPSPKNKVKIKIFCRDSNLVFQQLYEIDLDPKDKDVIKENTQKVSYESIHMPDLPENALDVVFVSEGYTKSQQSKFLLDVERFQKHLFSWKPYTHIKDKINTHAVFLESAEEGVDIPGDSIWKNTSLNATFYTFGIERYLSIPDLTKVYDRLSGVPVDQVCILVNSNIYGGGGIFNYYNIFTSDHNKAGFLYVHEFGHGFAGLADEYSSTEIDNTDILTLNIEPVEPNITTLKEFNVKWKVLVHDSIPIPTPINSGYDSVVGVFEGAAYSIKGIYRPAYDCAMRSSTCNEFCVVCQYNIERMVRFYGK